MTMISCVCVTTNLDNSLSSRGLGLDMFGKDLAFLFSYGIGQDNQQVSFVFFFLVRVSEGEKEKTENTAKEH